METKNSGINQEYEGGAVREVKIGKPRYDLIPRCQLKKLAELYERGARVYGERNMEKGVTPEYMDLCKQSAFRHFISWMESETDEAHDMACVWNIFTYEFLKEKIRKQTEELITKQ